uniref:protein FAR1-RELATED SEQUENCE 11-like n=1 Tax=Erigeron canadensis TaxID=72917 RepID=UPI001CB9A7CE|nr:protein FAR1-RELATED SEQUENCE 11-like [Erigeron canadensis]
MLDLNNLPEEENDEVVTQYEQYNAIGQSKTQNYEPFVGQIFCTFQEAYVFYQNYAKQTGFTVHKDRSDKRNDKTVKRDICCHRQGKKRLKVIDVSKRQRNTPSIKCECNAHIRVTLKKSCDIFPEEWHVTKFVNDHNHVLLSSEEMRFLPCNRIITQEDEEQILFYKEAGLDVRQIIRVMELQKQVQHEDLPFIDRDIRNLFTKVRKSLGSSDAKDLIDYMESSKQKDIKFHYAYTVDDERRLENIFWCYPQSFEWYERYGDVVVFDTTYKVNAYDMPYALFVGINNHGNTILFGTALLRNETVKTFRWLMKVDLAVEEIRSVEIRANMSKTLQHPSLETKSPLEEQAYKVLTLFAFKKFQDEFERATQYLVVRVEGNEFIIRYFEEGNHKCHNVFWDGYIASCSCKNFKFWGILCRHIFRALLHKDCFIIPPAYLPLRWCSDSLQSRHVIQNISIGESLTVEAPICVDSELEVGNNILCPPKSVTKGRPRKQRLKGGKELGEKKQNKCSMCNEIGHTKPTCGKHNKENIVGMENIAFDILPKKKKKDLAHNVGLNPVFTLKH